MRIKSIVIAIFIVTLYAVAAFSAQILVTWDANTEPDLAGYKVYCGTASGQYGAPVTVTTPSYTFQGATDKTTYYVAVSAIDTSGNESALSDEVSVYVPDVTPPAKPTGLLQRLIAWLKGIFGGLA